MTEKLHRLSLPEQESKLLEQVTTWAQENFRERLSALIAYGSATRGKYVPGKSDLNILLVLTDADFESLRRFGDALGEIADRLRVEPYIIRKDELARLARFFPTRLWDMRRSYVVICGEDMLGSLPVDVEALRLRAEHELFNLVVRMRHMVATPRPARNWQGILSAFLRAFTKDLRQLMLGITGEQIEDREELFRKASERWGLNERALSQMVLWRSGQLHLSEEEAQVAVQILLEAGERVVSTFA